MKALVALLLLVEVRKRMEQGVFERFYETTIEQLNQFQLKHTRHTSLDDDDLDHLNRPTLDEGNKPTHQGKLILDETVVEQAICYSTDLSLYNVGRELTEKLSDILHANKHLKRSRELIVRKRVRPTWLSSNKDVRVAK
jgi:hypothetical protein